MNVSPMERVLSRVRRGVKRLVPGPILEEGLLAFPGLYATAVVRFESNLDPAALQVLRAELTAVAHVPGEIVECGSSRCGTAAIMARHLREGGPGGGHCRPVLAFDTFSGFDPDELRREQARGLVSVTGSRGFRSTSLSYVERKLERLGLTGSVIPVAGRIQDTLPLRSGPVALALVDVDLEESTLFAARTLFERLSPGGRLLFDDYDDPDYRGARRAIDRFVDENLPAVAGHGLVGRLYRVVRT